MKKDAIAVLLISCGITLSSLPAHAQDSNTELFIKGAQTLKNIYDKARGIWPHKWAVIEYADGYCIFNRFRAKRTMRDVIDHATGVGDCDWWEWPESARRHVCLNGYAKARQLAEAHGGISDIRWIDHPTASCGN